MIAVIERNEIDDPEERDRWKMEDGRTSSFTVDCKEALKTHHIFVTMGSFHLNRQ